MFKKKPTIKPLAPLRSSDRRRAAESIIKDFDLKVPQQDGLDTEAKAAAVAEHSTLRNTLLPESTQSARFTTTHGPDLKSIVGTLYVGSHDGDEPRILWFKLEDRMYPTVYTLWCNPGIVPLVHTPAAVVQKMQNGADLMTPGLAGPPFPAAATKGSVVAVASLENPSIPVVIGLAEIDISTLESARGAKGHAVQTMHTYEDELWGWSTSGRPGTKAPEQIPGWGLDSIAELGDQVHQLHVGSDSGGGVTESKSQDLKSSQVEGSASNGGNITSEDVVVEDTHVFTTAEVDDAFRNAFLYGVYNFKQINKGSKNFGLDFPLTQSFIMANLVQPFLPIWTPNQENQLHIKKTSWKNIKKFIKSLDKEKLIKSKDRDGNEVVILDIDFDDRHIESFKPYRLPKRETGTQPSRGKDEKGTIDGHDDSVGQKLKKVELVRPKEKLGPLFEPSRADPKALYTSSELKTIITTYIESQNLVSANNKRLVKLDPFLANTVFDGQASIDKEVISKGVVPRDALSDRIAAACSPFWSLLREGTSQADLKPKAGNFPTITVTMETRSGNKTVTKVSGLENFFIRPNLLAEELKKTCAGSTSVEKMAGSSPKAPVMEVMVQGPQRDAVIRALEKRGVNHKWVDVVDKIKGKKK